MAPITPIKTASREALLKLTRCLIPTKIKAAIVPTKEVIIQGNKDLFFKKKISYFKG